VHDLVEHSERAGDIVQGEEVGTAMASLRDFMFQHVYLAAPARSEQARVTRVIDTLFEHYIENPELVESGVDGGDLATRITDYLAGMTDRFCLKLFEQITVPRQFR
jgi:dGTPase